MDKQRLQRYLADAIIGIDTLWGGDVMNPSGTGRFIADCWFSDVPLPPAYTHPAASKLRESGGVTAPSPCSEAIAAYLDAVDVRGAIAGVLAEAAKEQSPLADYLEAQAHSFEVMWDLAMEMIGKGSPVPYDRCVRVVTGSAPEPSDPTSKRQLLAELLCRAGYAAAGSSSSSSSAAAAVGSGSILQAVDRWRRDRLVPTASIPALGAAFIAQLDSLVARNLLPYLPAEVSTTPRANVEFLSIKNAFFSGSMNYLGRARQPDGTPEYEATYEINASLQISIPEFQQLVSHEVVPGHVTTFAYLQRLHVLGKVGFEGTVLTMNTRAAALSEGIANNAILIAHGVKEVADLPDPDLQIGVLLTLLQDDAKNQSSYLTWNENLPKEEVAKVLRSDYLVSEERADKLSGAWGRHPLLGRMYLPAYRFGTETVARLRHQHSPEKLLPVLYGMKGLVDTHNIEIVLRSLP
ncbi:MAG: hypothetical protein V2A73_06115 [Pseudomonadota bacterium]